ncbi:MAG: RNA polymerase sigma factor, partial [Planctomycetota bacterium]
KRDYTDIGGVGGAFLTTHWSLIDGIQSGNDGDRALIGLLLDRYWKPVYCYLRRKGYDNEQAKDLTQGFFHEVVLNRNLTERAEQCKGRFRSFLLHALNQYVIDQRREETAKKRTAGNRVSLDIADPPVIPQTICELRPEDSFNYAWKTALLDRVLSQVRSGCREQDMEVHWKVFHDKVVEPILDGIEAPSLKEICFKHAVEDEVKASNMIITVKRRFQSALREHVRNTVTSGDEIDDELKEILRLFPKKAQDLE